MLIANRCDLFTRGVASFTVMSLLRISKRSPAEGEFLFELDPEPLEESLTSYAGVPLLLRAARSLDVPGRRRSPLASQTAAARLRRSQLCGKLFGAERAGRRLPGGVERLREDQGLKQMLGHEIPSPEAPHKFLCEFHE